MHFFVTFITGSGARPVFLIGSLEEVSVFSIRTSYNLRFSQFSLEAEGFGYFGLQIRILQATQYILPAGKVWWSQIL